MKSKFSSSDFERISTIELVDGSSVAVMGGGPAGSLFSHFFLEMAERIDLNVELDIYDPRDFSEQGPRGCNMCGGIISESLVQNLAADGVNLPPSVVQRGISAYVLHTDAGSVRIATPVDEKRIASVYRGSGPLKAPEGEWESFDGFLQNLAIENGAKLIRQAVTDVTWLEGRPIVTDKMGVSKQYDLLVVATGVNTKALELFTNQNPDYKAPGTTRTALREYYLGAESVTEKLEDSMHLFLLNIPRLEFAAIIPKGQCATVCMLGEDINRALFDSFLESQSVKSLFEVSELKTNACACSPKMSLGTATAPFDDRIVFIGDCCVSRLYKDGIGAAYRTAKSAAATAVFRGIASSDFKRSFEPVCRSIARDNLYGKVIFFFTELIQRRQYAQRAVLRMVNREQSRMKPSPPMSTVLWDTFTGSAPYREIFLRTLNPIFLLTLVWFLLVSIPPLRWLRKGSYRTTAVTSECEQ
jgi:flavin-dependent dehydrogenase